MRSLRPAGAAIELNTGIGGATRVAATIEHPPGSSTQPRAESDGGGLRAHSVLQSPVAVADEAADAEA